MNEPTSHALRLAPSRCGALWVQPIMPMYFSIKAYKSTATRFENLDNIDELNVFVAEYLDKGFSKFIIKSYDQNGPRSVSYYNTVNGWVNRLAKRTLRD